MLRLIVRERTSVHLDITHVFRPPHRPKRESPEMVSVRTEVPGTKHKFAYLGRNADFIFRDIAPNKDRELSGSSFDMELPALLLIS